VHLGADATSKRSAPPASGGPWAGNEDDARPAIERAARSRSPAARRSGSRRTDRVDGSCVAAVTTTVFPARPVRAEDRPQAIDDLLRSVRRPGPRVRSHPTFGGPMKSAPRVRSVSALAASRVLPHSASMAGQSTSGPCAARAVTVRRSSARPWPASPGRRPWRATTRRSAPRRGRRGGRGSSPQRSVYAGRP